MTQTTAPDPLETYESVPAVSFHEANGGYKKGQWVKLTVRDWPTLLPQKDDDGNVETWDNGDPKLVLVVPVIDPEGNEKNLWAKKMGKKAIASIFQQLAKAQKKVREDSGDSSFRLGPNDVIAIKYVDDDRSVPPKKGNYPKMYAVQIQPGTRPATTADPLTESQPASVTAAESENPWDDGDAPATQKVESERLQPGGDPFGGATPDEGDEPPF